MAAPGTEHARLRRASRHPSHHASTFDAGAQSLILEAIEVRDEGVVTLEYGRYTLVLEPPGAPSITDTGKYILVHEARSDSATKVLFDIFNSELPAPQ